MSRRLDLDPPLLDGDTAERILGGSVPPADAPPGYAGATRVLEAASRPPEPAERAGEVEAVARFAAAVREAGDAPPARARSRRPRATRPRIAVAALAGSLTLTTGLAAAGALPGPAQTVAATVLDTVGIEVPSPAPAAPSPHPVEAPAGVKTTGPAPPATRTPPKAVPAPAPAPGRDQATDEGRQARPSDEPDGKPKSSAEQDGAGRHEGDRAEKAQHGPDKTAHEEKAPTGADGAEERVEKAQERVGGGAGDNEKGRREDRSRRRPG